MKAHDKLNTVQAAQESDTSKYHAMFTEARKLEEEKQRKIEQWKLEGKRQALQNQNYWQRPMHPQQAIYAEALRQIRLERIAEAHTDVLPHPTTPAQESRAVDWNADAWLRSMTPVPVTETVGARITIKLENEQPYILRLVTGTAIAQDMLELALAEYGRVYEGRVPALIRISPSTLLRIPARNYWTQNNQTYYHSVDRGTITVCIDTNLDHLTVQCEETSG